MIFARGKLHEPRGEAGVDRPGAEVDRAVGRELDQDLGSRTHGRAADGDQPLEIGAARVAQDELGLGRELGELHDRGSSSTSSGS